MTTIQLRPRWEIQSLQWPLYWSGLDAHRIAWNGHLFGLGVGGQSYILFLRGSIILQRRHGLGVIQGVYTCQQEWKAIYVFSCLINHLLPYLKTWSQNALPELRDGHFAIGHKIPESFTEQVPRALPSVCHAIHHAELNQWGVKKWLWEPLLKGSDCFLKEVGRCLGEQANGKGGSGHIFKGCFPYSTKKISEAGAPLSFWVLNYSHHWKYTTNSLFFLWLVLPDVFPCCQQRKGAPCQAEKRCSFRIIQMLWKMDLAEQVCPLSQSWYNSPAVCHRSGPPGRQNETHMDIAHITWEF